MSQSKIQSYCDQRILDRLFRPRDEEGLRFQNRREGLCDSFNLSPNMEKALIAGLKVLNRRNGSAALDGLVYRLRTFAQDASHAIASFFSGSEQHLPTVGHSKMWYMMQSFQTGKTNSSGHSESFVDSFSQGISSLFTN